MTRRERANVRFVLAAIALIIALVSGSITSHIQGGSSSSNWYDNDSYNSGGGWDSGGSDWGSSGGWDSSGDSGSWDSGGGDSGSW